MGFKSRTAVKYVDKGWNALRKMAKNVKQHDSFVKVGLLGEGAKKNDRRGDEKLTNLEIGIIHEFGSPAAGIPERSFVRATVNAKRGEYALLLSRLVKEIYSLKIDVRQALGILGARAAADMKNRITQGAGIPPPLRASTIAAKGSDRPLVDTGQLVNAISWAVTMTGGKEGH